MKHRVEVELNFVDKKDALDFINHIEKIKAKTTKPTPVASFSMETKCRYHECKHDEIGAGPCSGYVYVDFNGPEKEHK